MTDPAKKLDSGFIFKVYLLTNRRYIGSCKPSERHNFLKRYMRAKKLKEAPLVEFKLVSNK